MNIFSSLFQPNKSHLSPAGRAFIAWLEIIIVGIVASVASAGLDYLNGHPGDLAGLWPLLLSTLVISVLKALSVLSIPRQPTVVESTLQQPHIQPAPPVVIHNHLPPVPTSPAAPQSPPAQAQPSLQFVSPSRHFGDTIPTKIVQ